MGLRCGIDDFNNNVHIVVTLLEYIYYSCFLWMLQGIPGLMDEVVRTVNEKLLKMQAVRSQPMFTQEMLHEFGNVFRMLEYLTFHQTGLQSLITFCCDFCICLASCCPIVSAVHR